MKAFAVVLALGLVCLTALGLYRSTTQPMGEYAQWKARFGVTYSQTEDKYRENIFNANLQKINTHNGLLGRSYEMGVNQFTALTPEEFAQGYLLPAFDASEQTNSVESQPNGPTVDWEVKGSVTSVKNQGSCSASYAFSAVGAIESMSSIYYRAPTELSAQQVVDCSSTYGNNGCFSGRMDNTFYWATDRGLSTSTEYSWAGSQQQCRSTSGSFKKTNGYRNITDCDSLALQLQKQPISVTVDGTNFQFYRSGLYSDCGMSLNSALLLIGMNDQSWRLKNSWGTTWGESGYIRFYRGNTCGLCLQASYPIPK